MEISYFLEDEVDYAPIARYRWYHNYLNGLRQAFLEKWCSKQGGLPKTNPLEKTTENIIKEVVENRKEELRTKIGKRTKKAREYARGENRKILVNRLMYSWLSEAAIDFPHSEKPMYLYNSSAGGEDISDQRMMFADWKITKMYYSIYASSYAAVLATTGERFKSHVQVIRTFNRNVLLPFRGDVYVFPFNCMLEKEELKARDELNQYPQVSRELKRWLTTTAEEKRKRLYEDYKKERERDPTKPRKYLRSKRYPESVVKVGIISFLDCLYRLRKWANYLAVRPFLRGLRDRDKRRELDTNITWITFLLNLLNELYLIHLLRNRLVFESMERLNRLTKKLGYFAFYMDVRKGLYENHVRPALKL